MTKKLPKSIKKRLPELFFLLKFFLIYGVLQFIIISVNMEPVTVSIAAFEASLMGMENHGNKIIHHNATYVIDNSCTGFVSISVLMAIVFSFKKPDLRKKILIFVPCAIALFLINLVRVYLVLFTGINVHYSLAEPVHTASWFLMSGAIIVLWYKATQKFAGLKDMGEML